MRSRSKISAFIFATIFIILIIVFPTISSCGISHGLIISSNVIIPSLFPFMVCVLMLIKSGFTIKSKFFNNILHKIFGQNFDMFFVFLMSMLGGYPVGARLINELHKQKAIDNKTANIMLTYCVNAGPAFVVSVVGAKFNSNKIGIVLLVSHITASIIMSILCSKELKHNNCQYKLSSVKNKTFSENFVESVADASSSIIGICSFVILFSSINAYVDYFFGNMTIIKYISFFTEITYAVAKTKNIYFISFLLGFSGISIWCQVFAMSSDRKINFTRFAVGRILHGVISTVITRIIVIVFNTKLLTFSNNVTFIEKTTYSNAALFISMLIMFIILFIFIYSKNNGGKIINDVV